MKIDSAGRDFIYNQEGVRLKAYLDVVGIPTIGCGMTYYPDGKKVKIGDTISLNQCDTMFKAIVADFEKSVSAAIKVAINQNQFNALVSLAYNIGTAGFAKSTLVKRINAGASPEQITAAFAMWNKAGGKTNKVLTNRRADEAKLYFKA
ncbi:lysozyme [Mucilaginibacter psychrotolerans]|uniref:Lysozyme n=1 Tax=Mucilaginibacter psychrotolerans TaxID=1524096 RepID=A0A4Y8S5U9_9SPHI|nr:lysozyme [Mucilaginibacter psychrotolerans]TFF34379.1 lysozyme [Mucilaginibacter psychrotolerans]